MRQGFIPPDGYKKNFATIYGYTHIKRPINKGDCYMPVWGRVCDGHTFTAIVDTPYLYGHLQVLDLKLFSFYRKSNPKEHLQFYSP